jgi:hypothetical protein
MKATNFPTDDDRGFITACLQLFHLALAPSPVGHRRATESAPKVSWLERFDRWAAKARQRDREAYLAASKDVFELEARIRQTERQSYF